MVCAQIWVAHMSAYECAWERSNVHIWARRSPRLASQSHTAAMLQVSSLNWVNTSLGQPTYLIWALGIVWCLSQHWLVALVTMLASTGLTVKQRVTLRRNGRDVEVSSFISPWGLILTLLMLRSRAVWTSARPRETQSPESCVCSRRRRWTPCWRSPFWNAHIGQKTEVWVVCLNKPILHVDSQYFTRIDCFW